MSDWHSLTVLERDAMIREYAAEGEAAYLDGNTMADCPHRPRTSQQAIWWMRGFANAQQGSIIASAN